MLGQSQAAGKEIVGLETLEFQIGIFDALPPAQQQAMLEQTLAELDEAEPPCSSDMVAAWRDGELESLSAELLDEFDEFPGLYDTIVTKRNNAWVPDARANARRWAPPSRRRRCPAPRRPGQRHRASCARAGTTSSACS